jgi:hypothetical protein
VKWIKAVESIGEDAKKRKTKTWRIINSNDTPLGIVRFYPPWRRFVFEPHAGTIYEEVCLRDIAEFCVEKTKAWRLEIKNRRKTDVGT